VRARLAIRLSADLAALPSPDRVGQALVATEDSRFFSTPGIDPVSAVRAGLATLTGSNDTGAATLEQQLAKNLYYPQDDGLFSKVAEAELSLKLVARYSKNDVLRMYLAEAYFGYGLPAAAEGYFGVSPAQLSWARPACWPVWFRPRRRMTPSFICPRGAYANGTFWTDWSLPASCRSLWLMPPSLHPWACADTQTGQRLTDRRKRSTTGNRCRYPSRRCALNRTGNAVQPIGEIWTGDRHAGPAAADQPIWRPHPCQVGGCRGASWKARRGGAVILGTSDSCNT
jgi:hypothetical protein